MISCSELAAAVLHEAKILTQKHTFKSELVERAPLPPHKELELVLSVLFGASLLVEEGRPCCPRLIYSVEGGSQSNLHILERPLAFSPEVLRKISPALGELDFLSWSIQGGVPVITGIQVHRPAETPQLVFAVPKAGNIDVLWQFARIVSFRDSEMRQLSKCGLVDTGGLCSMLSRAFGSFEPHFLGSIIRRVSMQKHGGALWILSHTNHPIGIEMNYPVTNNEATLLERFENHISRENWLNSLANLAAVDGAVLLDSHLRVLGFGAFIKTDQAIEIDRYKGDGTQEAILSTSLGGGRHRSAVSFCHTHSPSAAIVASADGRMTFVATLKEHSRPICSEVTSMGFLDKFL